MSLYKKNYKLFSIYTNFWKKICKFSHFFEELPTIFFFFFFFGLELPTIFSCWLIIHWERRVWWEAITWNKYGYYMYVYVWCINYILVVWSWVHTLPFKLEFLVKLNWWSWWWMWGLIPWMIILECL